MSRRKGEITSQTIERRFPYHVQHWYRAGVGNGFLRMLAWIRERGHNERTAGRWENGWQGVRYCFATRRQADEFAMDFGGERIDKVLLLRAFTIQPIGQREPRPMEYRLLSARIEEPG